MTTMRPEDVAAMFDLAPPAASASTESTREAADAANAEEAALAAELLSTTRSGGVATDAPDSRSDRRAKVSWPAMMRLPDGHVIELRVRDVSEAGVGLMSDKQIPADTVVHFEMRVPALEEGGELTTVEGEIRTTYTVAHGSEILCGGIWQAPPLGVQLVNLWIQRLWR